MEFGELEDVTLRDVWGHEARDFTPWVVENIGRLSKAVGLPMEPEGSEVAVEQFSADIVARNPVDGSRVLIENQLENSDHTHLGQVLTYLAGVQAQTVIWVARDFNEAHLSAIRWLNDHTADPFAFFAVRVRVVQIADSPLVPLFEVLERPSAWDRNVRETIENETSELTRRRREFWTFYTERYPDDGVPIGYAASSFWCWVESAELNLTPFLAQDAVGVWLRGRRGEAEEAVRERIRPWEPSLSAELDVEVGEGTGWGSFRTNSRYVVDAKDRGNWPAMTDWLHDTIAGYRRVLEGPPAPPSSDGSSGGDDVEPMYLAPALGERR